MVGKVCGTKPSAATHWCSAGIVGVNVLLPCVVLVYHMLESGGVKSAVANFLLSGLLCCCLWQHKSILQYSNPQEWSSLYKADCLYAETGRQATVKLAKRSGEYDYAILEAGTDQPHILACTQLSHPLRGSNLVLASFRIGIAEYAPLFSQRLGFASVMSITVSPHDHHLFYSCPTFRGDSGAALLLKDGQLVGLHTEVVNSLRERLDRERVVDRLSEVESLDAVVSGGLGQGCVAVLASVFAT